MAREADSDPDSGNPKTPDACEPILRWLLEPKERGPRYQIRGEVGRGAMGMVLKVWDRDLHRNLAMKVLREVARERIRAGGPDLHSRALTRFLEEAQITGQLDHPAIVPVHEIGLDHEGRIFFTMKLVKGSTLGEVLRQVHAKNQADTGGWTLTRALGVVLKVCEAMAYAHDKGVLHRDLKPANILVGTFGAVYVMDWGLARLIGQEDHKDIRIRPEFDAGSSIIQTERSEQARDEADSPIITMDGDVIGTPAYMSPEQAAGKVDQVTARSDIYSMGCVLYHLLSGHVPYVRHGERVSPHTMLAMVLTAPPPPVQELAPDLPPDLTAICEKAMARDPDRRYPSMLGLAEDLQAFLEGRVVQAYKTGALAELSKWVGRNRKVAAFVGLAAALAFFGLGRSTYVEATSNRLLERKNLALSEAYHDMAAARDEADRQEILAQERADRVLRLADAKRLDQLEARAEALGPAEPAHVPEYGRWLEESSQLFGRLEVHRQSLETLRERALEQSEADLQQDAASHPLAGELNKLRAAAETMTLAIDAGRVDTTVSEMLQAELAIGEQKIQDLSAEIARTSRRLIWRFQSAEDQWEHDTLAELVSRLEAFGDLEHGLIALVQRRMEFASTVEERTILGPDASDRWARAIDSIASIDECPAYHGLRIQPQIGLLPIGRDPVSGLWEFVHLHTGTVPERDPASGKLQLDAQNGLILVLIPGGTFWMGSQSQDPSGVNYDPSPGTLDATSYSENPVHQVSLDAFFLSKYEMTQGQWTRITGKNPSFARPKPDEPGEETRALHPVEQVSWVEAKAVLRNLSLVLPTEAQWEYAARAGTSTTWWTGSERESLVGAGNLADKQWLGNESISEISWLDDGHAITAPVNSYLPNPFGLHGVIGNVFEWCLEQLATYYNPVRGGRGERVFAVDDPFQRAARGGSYNRTAVSARSANRYGFHPQSGFDDLGMRPARPIQN